MDRQKIIEDLISGLLNQDSGLKISDFDVVLKLLKEHERLEKAGPAFPDLDDLRKRVESMEKGFNVIEGRLKAISEFLFPGKVLRKEP